MIDNFRIGRRGLLGGDPAFRVVAGRPAAHQPRQLDRVDQDDPGA